MHRFGNFRREDDGRLPSMREALQESINLPFVRLMRDLVSYSTYQTANGVELLKNDDNPERLEYLRRFADREGSVFLLNAREASLVLSCARAAALAPGWDAVWRTARQSQALTA